ncbi:MAG: dihydroorotate dehydrogenase electron transfer subunit [Oscillospiraceae bacterium]|nr:dihydroorotate dehydrogenase electron transfer subunit [Oscillospiraceae bacterium]MDE7171017.1 dihydroorotate dehydrogenase electron transfer subunit [Oscillospiraceae bacterium]
MKQGLYTLCQRRALARGVWELRLSGDTGPITAPGQFVNIQLDGCFLRRPISVCHWDEDSLTLVFKVVGKGTAALAELREGQTLDLLCGLGNGFDLRRCGQRPLLVGGGLGVAPLYGLAKALLAEGKAPTAVLGFNSKGDIFYEEEFRALGVDTVITTVDGSAGVKGFVTDALPEQYDVFCACGPLPMMKAVCAAAPTPGFVSLEERMGCGFGACMGCSCETKAGSKRICRDGPVFAKEELLW